MGTSVILFMGTTLPFKNDINPLLATFCFQNYNPNRQKYKLCICASLYWKGESNSITHLDRCIVQSLPRLSDTTTQEVPASHCTVLVPNDVCMQQCIGCQGWLKNGSSVSHEPMTDDMRNVMFPKNLLVEKYWKWFLTWSLKWKLNNLQVHPNY